MDITRFLCIDKLTAKHISEYIFWLFAVMFQQLCSTVLTSEINTQKLASKNIECPFLDASTAQSFLFIYELQFYHTTISKVTNEDEINFFLFLKEICTLYKKTLWYYEAT